MPLDHYVSQVHLRNFYSPALGGRMFGIRKNDLKIFPCRSEDVCRRKDGNTNEFLEEPRAIEEYLKTIEPNYNASLECLRRGKFDHRTIYTISGFVAYVALCAPAAIRLNAEPLRGQVDATARVLDAQGLIPPPPEELGGKNITELLDKGSVRIAINGKYPQAIGISQIEKHATLYGNVAWEILINREARSPFFTSDFPVAIERTADPRVLNRVIPLAPDLALRIRPDLDVPRDLEPFSFDRLVCRRKEATHAEIRLANQLIVRCAESFVFYRDELPWVRAFIEKNRNFRIEARNTRIPTPRGFAVITMQNVQPYTYEK